MSASYLAVFFVVLLALSFGAYLFVARSARETLEPVWNLPEGQAAYASTMRHVAAKIAVFDIPLVIVVGGAAFVLAKISLRPLLEARAREERFAADAAHELRSPLATIATVAQAALAREPAAQDRALARIADVAIDASGLLGDLLALMRDSPDDSRLHEPVDLRSLVVAVVRDVDNRAGTIVIRAEHPPHGVYTIGDARALRQLATNLINNAVRHATSRVTVEILESARFVEVRVEDDGGGVAVADRQRIFERFYKSNPNGVGSGLGLPIAQHIAERHGGTLVLEGAARFIARFPRAPA